jgi:hypothetical protein
MAGLHFVIQSFETRLVEKPALPQGRQANPDPIAFQFLAFAGEGTLVEQRLGVRSGALQ